MGGILKYPPHPAAQAFVLMEGDAFRGLVADIKANGQLFPIILCKFEGADCILDGRNRELACAELGIEPRFAHYTGNDPIAYVISANLARRHMNEGQRALVANRLALLDRGRPKQSGKSAGLTQGAVAELMNVGERTVRQAKEVQRHAVPEVIKAIETGDISLNAASDIAKLTREQQLDELEQLKSLERPKREAPAQRDQWMTREIRLVESEVRGLQALADMADDHGTPLAREGARVLRKMAPQVERE